MKTLVNLVLAVWFALVFVLGARGAFVRLPGQPPLPILFGVVTPLAAFGAAMLASRGFREFALSVDARLSAAIQAWRAGGLVFIALMAYGLLPGAFAWPAGLGDIFIGVTAPGVVLALVRRPTFLAGAVYRIWNLLGILDLVVAIGTGAMSSWAIGTIAGAPTTEPM